ncbi:MAG: hypothetical protein GPJ54_03785 [Candidatus Heimdallarchaeota archaeon]|nr:hypothetical protein [Candidatus Heimdallarchaeota archaeon]
MITGLNIGSVSVKMIELDENGDTLNFKIIPHKGQPKEIVENLYKITNSEFYGISGHFGQFSESEAIERALKQLSVSFDVIVSLGGEAFAVYLLENNRIINVLSHNRCAAGSGEFLLQQIGRLNLTLPEAIVKAKKGKKIRIASRCSVHCKSDITHKLNRQEAILEDILYSIHDSMVGKIVSLLTKSNHKVKSVLVIGGLSQNEVMVELLQKNLDTSSVEILPESPYFEAYGTALLVKDNPEFKEPVISIKPMFQTLPVLTDAKNMVRIINSADTKRSATNGRLILGIDGGSTTTKVALINLETKEIIGSHYTRTNGDPIGATKECLIALVDQIGNESVELIATTGSARDIIGAFIGTSAVYNEISAHAIGALSIDSEVDTIFEIGGQDAKYIYIENLSPVDYAMNAACSAGTGSFLEESAQGDLDISVHDIGEIALKAPSPVRFNAECAAFINSDIRGALQEGYSRENIIAGLVNSIVHNYLTKVKGPRKVGNKIFLQGGVAKNKSIAYAFAQATGKQIIIPPNPELMGAFGVALMAHDKVKLGILDPEIHVLGNLIQNEMETLDNFVCRSCDNYCTINRYRVGERKFPFGGKCSKYENQWKSNEKIETAEDFVEMRNKIIFSVADQLPTEEKRSITIGIPKALTTHFLLPLYYTFLKKLGFDIVISSIDAEGDLYSNAPFCFPVQVAHGAVLNLVNSSKESQKNIDFIFFPQIQRMPYPKAKRNSYLCPITQASPFILQKAFPEIKFISPTMNFLDGYENCNAMIDIIVDKFDFRKDFVKQAYQKAVNEQLRIENEMRILGSQALAKSKETNSPAIILVGRSYNAFPNETSQSIGRKLASKGIITIPYDCLGDQKNSETSWYFSNLILDAARLTEKHDNLFLLYISNFGCNIDTFTQEYLRSEIGTKPYLKLDIDSHTADAGTQTRIEAFLEIIENYRPTDIAKNNSQFKPAKIIKDQNTYKVRNSAGEIMQLNDRRIKYHFPVFSKYHKETVPMAFRWMGYQASSGIDLSVEQLDLGLQFTSGSECLPFPIHLGQLLTIYEQKKTGELIGFYMIPGGEPCVITAYFDILEKFIEEHKMEDVFLFAPHESNDYYKMSKFGLFRHFPFAITLADIMIEIHNVLETVGKSGSVILLNKYWDELMADTSNHKLFHKRLPNFIDQLSSIAIKDDPKNYPKIVVTGDFFVRFDPLFFKGLLKKYADKGIILKPVDLSELLLYPAYDDLQIYGEDINISPNTKRGLFKAAVLCKKKSSRKYIENWMSIKVLERFERNIREKFERSGLLISKENRLGEIMNHAAEHISPSIYGESILTVGKASEAMIDGYQGILVVGPFSCLPFRISESIVKPISLENNFPYLSYETDGRSVPPTFLRLVDVHIQQVLREFYKGREGYEFTSLPVVENV